MFVIRGPHASLRVPSSLLAAFRSLRCSAQACSSSGSGSCAQQAQSGTASSRREEEAPDGDGRFGGEAQVVTPAGMVQTRAAAAAQVEEECRLERVVSNLQASCPPTPTAPPVRSCPAAASAASASTHMARPRVLPLHCHCLLHGPSRCVRISHQAQLDRITDCRSPKPPRGAAPHTGVLQVCRGAGPPV